MTTRTTIDAQPQRSWASLFVSRPWKPEIETVIPVVRWAILARYTPPLTIPVTERIHRAFHQMWPVWQQKYRAAVAERANVDVDSLVIDSKEVVRLRYDGDTPMIDLPQVHSLHGADFPFDLRNCAALCLKDYSSKVWTRVGVPYEAAEGCDADQLPAVLSRYRALAKSMAEWFRDELFAVAEPLLENREHEITGALEVTMVGLRVTDDAVADFDEWLFESDPDGNKLSSQTVRPNLDSDELRRFLTQAANLDYDVRDVGAREPGAFWMSMPMAVELGNGDLALRKALCLVRALGDVVQITGVGLDDSRWRDFAAEIALKLSRVVANRF